MTYKLSQGDPSSRTLGGRTQKSGIVRNLVFLTDGGAEVEDHAKSILILPLIALSRIAIAFDSPSRQPNRCTAARFVSVGVCWWRCLPPHRH